MRLRGHHEPDRGVAGPCRGGAARSGQRDQLLPDDGGRRAAGADQFLASPADEEPVAACDVKPREIDIASGIEAINRATVLDVRSVRSTWAGLRTFAPDRLPVVGFDPDAAGFFWCAGQGGTGIQTSPAISEI